MSKVAVVYWSSTGNTEAMAEAVGAGIAKAGKEADVVEVSSASMEELKSSKSICTWMSCNGRRST